LARWPYSLGEKKFAPKIFIKAKMLANFFSPSYGCAEV
jgi:hypothetical protein